MKKVILLCLIFLFSCSRGKEETNKTMEQTIPVTVTTPQYRTLTKSLRLTGRLKGEPDIMVFPEIPGYFLEYRVKEGEWVEKDYVIALIERKIPGMEYNPIPVKAPISGRVSALKREKGEMVGPQAYIARIARYQWMIAVINLPEKFSNSLKIGDPAKIFPLSENKEIMGKVKWVSGTLDNLTGTQEVHILFKNSGSLLPGAICEVEVSVMRKENVLSIERECVLGEVVKYVFLKKGNRAEKRIIETGLETENRVEILKGLIEKDTVVLSGSRTVKEGDLLSVKEGHK